MLNKGNNGNYSILSEIEVDKDFGGSQDCALRFTFGRINKMGYGVYAANRLMLQADHKPLGTSRTVPAAISVEGIDRLKVELPASTTTETIKIAILNHAFRLGSLRFSSQFLLGGIDGYLFESAAAEVLEIAKSAIDGAELAKTWLTSDMAEYLYLRVTTDGTYPSSAKNRRKLQDAIIECVREAGEDYTNLTWYQLQYAVLQTEAPYYVDNDTAIAWIEQHPALVAIAGGDTA